MEKEKERLSKANALLLAHNPLSILNKGYAIIEDSNRNVISEVGVLKQARSIKVTLKDGSTEIELARGN